MSRAKAGSCNIILRCSVASVSRIVLSRFGSRRRLVEFTTRALHMHTHSCQTSRRVLHPHGVWPSGLPYVVTHRAHSNSKRSTRPPTCAAPLGACDVFVGHARSCLQSQTAARIETPMLCWRVSLPCLRGNSTPQSRRAAAIRCGVLNIMGRSRPGMGHDGTQSSPCQPDPRS